MKLVEAVKLVVKAPFTMEDIHRMTPDQLFTRVLRPTGSSGSRAYTHLMEQMAWICTFPFGRALVSATTKTVEQLKQRLGATTHLPEPVPSRVSHDQPLESYLYYSLLSKRTMLVLDMNVCCQVWEELAKLELVSHATLDDVITQIGPLIGYSQGASGASRSGSLSGGAASASIGDRAGVADEDTFEAMGDDDDHHHDGTTYNEEDHHHDIGVAGPSSLATSFRVACKANDSLTGHGDGRGTTDPYIARADMLSVGGNGSAATTAATLISYPVTVYTSSSSSPYTAACPSTTGTIHLSPLAPIQRTGGSSGTTAIGSGASPSRTPSVPHDAPHDPTHHLHADTIITEPIDDDVAATSTNTTIPLDHNSQANGHYSYPDENVGGGSGASPFVDTLGQVIERVRHTAQSSQNPISDGIAGGSAAAAAYGSGGASNTNQQVSRSPMQPSGASGGGGGGASSIQGEGRRLTRSQSIESSKVSFHCIFSTTNSIVINNPLLYWFPFLTENHNQMEGNLYSSRA